MEPGTILSIAIPVAAFLLGHFHVLLPAPTPKAPDFPSTFGHGELVRYLLQQLANLSAGDPAAPIPAKPATPPLDLQQVIQQLLAMLERSMTPPAAPPKS